jgi:predicted dehydrogenase
MFKIAILGSENSHCAGFASVLAPKEGEKRFPDIALVGVAGDEASNKAVTDKYDVPVTTTNAADFAGKVDAVMITARHGGLHLPYAMPYIHDGAKLWIDKPITASVADARELVRLAHEKNLLLCGGSSLAGAEGTVRMKKLVREKGAAVTGGHVTAPVNLVNDYGNFWFYSQHLTQMVTEVFGQDIVSVEAKRKGDGVGAVFHYPAFDVTAYFGTGYSITVYLGGYGVACEKIDLGGEYFLPELCELADMLREGKVRQTPEELVYPVFIIDALIRSMEAGGVETVPESI